MTVHPLFNQHSIIMESSKTEENRSTGFAAGRDDTSLRWWVDRPGRSVDRIECLHIFRQVVDMVSMAHSHGVVVANARPSCFLLSVPCGRVAFIESASCSSESSGESNEKEESRRLEGGFPLKQILVLEYEWYTSPEEGAEGSGGTFASDIYRLGVLLFEIFCTFESFDEKLRSMSNLRHRVLPPQLLLKWPKEASFCLWLLHPQPDTRPKMSEVLQSEFLSEPKLMLEERESAIKLKEKIEDQELLLEFLLHLRQEKEETADELHDTICLLSSDIGEVESQQSRLKNRVSFHQWDKDEHSVTEKANQTNEEGSSCYGSRKRVHDEVLSECPQSEVCPDIHETVLSKNSRLMNNFKKLEGAYFATRCGPAKPAEKHVDRHYSFTPATSTGRGSGSSVDFSSSKVHTTNKRREWINPFLEGLCKYLSYSQLKVKADLKQGDLLSSSNLICSSDFDRDKELFATAGVNRKIKIFDCNTVLNEDHDIHYPVVEMATRSRISCVCWNSYIKSQLASSDFEGVVQVWDVARSQVSLQMKEHERRVWCVDFSRADPTTLASGSDDCAVKLWNINKAILLLLLLLEALGPSEQKRIVPLCTLTGHGKTVSYVKYLDASTIVSASTDSTLKLWDLSKSLTRVIDTPIQTFTGHTNMKNFVGLSIYDGYIATGSETNEVFIYHKAFPMPVLSYKFGVVDPISGREVEDTTHFISCVSWRGQSTTLLAANSTGNIKLLEMV